MTLHELSPFWLAYLYVSLKAPPPGRLTRVDALVVRPSPKLCVESVAYQSPPKPHPSLSQDQQLGLKKKADPDPAHGEK